MAQIYDNTTNLEALLAKANALPDALDTSDATAIAQNILESETAYVNGEKVTGTMPNNGDVSQILTTSTTSYTIPEGYHAGSGKVSINTETKTAMPTKSTQDITPTSGKVLSKVTINPIPDEYTDVSGVTAEAKYVAQGYSFVDKDGNTVEGMFDPTTIDLMNSDGDSMVVTGGRISDMSGTPRLTVIASNLGTATYAQVLKGYTFTSDNNMNSNGAMTNNGAAALSINPLSSESVTIPEGYHNGSGKATITNHLLNELNSIEGSETAATTVADGVSNISDNVDMQAGLIEQIQTALQGKAGGGGDNIETCDVTFTSSAPRGDIHYTTYYNNNYSQCTLPYSSYADTVVIPYAVVGSTIIVLDVENQIGTFNFIYDSDKTLVTSSASALTNGTTHSNIIITPISTENILVTMTHYSPCCFTAGTKILISTDGDEKNIEDIEIGDNIVSYNIESGDNYMAQVTHVTVKENTTDIAEVTFDNGAILTMNAYHPLYSENGFKSITQYKGYAELKIGDKIKSFDGWHTVININRYASEPIVTYNLDIKDTDENPDVDTNDTYYANGIVVKNGYC